MKISVNDQELFTMSEIQKKVISNDIAIDKLDSDLKRRVNYILGHTYEQCFKRLKAEWESKLAARYESVPTDPDALAALIFAQPDYTYKSSREESLNG